MLDYLYFKSARNFETIGFINKERIISLKREKTITKSLAEIN